MEELKLSQEIPALLLPWFQANQRQLPWREDRQPYHIWLSEIMLQQTRVEAVKSYYTRFLQVLPTVRALAECDDELLAKLWEGLGYYSRVRNLKKAAQIIVSQYGGVFPRTYQEIRQLPGIGDYTAGAVCSIAYDMPTPAVDGNVLRVVSRLRNDPRPIDSPKIKQEVQDILQEIYPPEAGMFTQALMELGATLCGPNRKPECEGCPLSGLCLACKAGTAETLPQKSPKREKRREEKTVFILTCGDCVALNKRPDSGLLAGLWEFPNVPGILTPQQAIDTLIGRGISPTSITKQSRRKHIFTHIVWNMLAYYVEVQQPGGDFTWIPNRELSNAPALPTAFRMFWEDNP